MKKKCVDTGMGVERTITVLNGFKNVYETEFFKPIIERIAEISNKEYKEFELEFRIIADHLRTSVFLISEGILPSNIQQGYILRRLLRRAIRTGRKIGIASNFLSELSEEITKTYSCYDFNNEEIKKELKKEEDKFNTALLKGEIELNKMIQKLQNKIIPGDLSFKLYDTYGFPIELTQEIAKEKGYEVDIKGFEKAFLDHRQKSKLDKGTFKSGLADSSDDTIRLHTATHLLHRSLKNVLGESVAQKGSNITKDRLRFDFSYDSKMTKEQIERVEQIVNEQIKKELEVNYEVMSLEDARKKGATALFDLKYDEFVKVYSIGDFSLEVCTGPHVKNTKELKYFKIKKEQSSSAGVRRIKAVLEK